MRVCEHCVLCEARERCANSLERMREGEKQKTSKSTGRAVRIIDTFRFGISGAGAFNSGCRFRSAGRKRASDEYNCAQIIIIYIKLRVCLQAAQLYTTIERTHGLSDGHCLGFRHASQRVHARSAHAPNAADVHSCRRWTSGHKLAMLMTFATRLAKCIWAPGVSR